VNPDVDRHQKDVGDGSRHDDHEWRDEDGRVAAHGRGAIPDRRPHPVHHYGAQDAWDREPRAVSHASTAPRPAQGSLPLRCGQAGQQVDDRVLAAGHRPDM
jgi:hypothetical protein